MLVAADDPTALIGVWHFTRTIVDHRDGAVLSAVGRAVLSGSDSVIGWHEDGMLRRGDGEYPITRALQLRRNESGIGVTGVHWSVEFGDGRPFHDWAPGSPLVHRCGADTYRGRVSVTAASAWHIEWNVHGPAKDYTIATQYRRGAIADTTIA